MVGRGSKEVRDHLEGSSSVSFFAQQEQLGTADAVKSADVGTLEGNILICNGDHPLISGDDYKEALGVFEKSGAELMVLSSVVKNPFGFGRIHRKNKGRV